MSAISVGAGLELVHFGGPTLVHWPNSTCVVGL
jgi:hypothetical protein